MRVYEVASFYTMCVPALSLTVRLKFMLTPFGDRRFNRSVPATSSRPISRLSLLLFFTGNRSASTLSRSAQRLPACSADAARTRLSGRLRTTSASRLARPRRTTSSPCSRCGPQSGFPERCANLMKRFVQVECLGACSNAPMVQINDKFYVRFLLSFPSTSSSRCPFAGGLDTRVDGPDPRGPGSGKGAQDGSSQREEGQRAERSPDRLERHRASLRLVTSLAGC